MMLTEWSGNTIVLAINPVTRGPDPIDLTVAGTRLTFMAKRSLDDPDGSAVFTKTYVAGGSADGISVTGTGDKNTGTITIEPEESREAVGASGQDVLVLVWELELVEPGGRISTLDSDTFRIRRRVKQAVS